MRLLLGILIFGLWGSFARYWYVCKIKNHCEPQEVVEEPTTPERLKISTLLLVMKLFWKDIISFLSKKAFLSQQLILVI